MKKVILLLMGVIILSFSGCNSEPRRMTEENIERMNHYVDDNVSYEYEKEIIEEK